jgi:hypothetical protein
VIDDGPIVAIERGGEVLVVLHVGDGDGDARLVLPEGCRLAFATGPGVVLVDDELLLPEDAAAIVELEPDEPDLDAPLDAEDRALIDAAGPADIDAASGPSTSEGGRA